MLYKYINRVVKSLGQGTSKFNPFPVNVSLIETSRLISNAKEKCYKNNSILLKSVGICSFLLCAVGLFFQCYS